MKILFDPVIIANDFGDEVGRLVFDEGRLVAVLSCLGGSHGELAGQWYVEAAFGDSLPAYAPLFVSLESVEDWLERQAASGGLSPPSGA